MTRLKRNLFVLQVPNVGYDDIKRTQGSHKHVHMHYIHTS